VKYRLLLALALVTTTTTADGAPPEATLKVAVSQLHSDTGRVGCNLYRAAKGFPTEPAHALQIRWCSIDKRRSLCSFAPTPAGTYAVACFHDENGNGKFDTNFLGVPLEGNVVSNHAKGTFGPPSFDSAKTTLPSGPAELFLRMAY
jgi:uncharacterized protein (DUF2141 family)